MTESNCLTFRERDSRFYLGHRGPGQNLTNVTKQFDLVYLACPGGGCGGVGKHRWL